MAGRRPGHPDDEHLAYGEYSGGGQGGEQDRGFISDTFNRFTGRQSKPAVSDNSNVTQSYQPHLQGQPQSTSGQQQEASATPHSSSSGAMSGLFDKLHSGVHSLGADLKERMSGEAQFHSHSHESGACSDDANHSNHRFQSFVPRRQGNDVKWYVDGCGYMYAVSLALEKAKHSIWILDWWLSPELYLRRPPAKNEQYRLDRMLQAAAERGVKVNVIVYKEVAQALTRKLITPFMPDYLHSLLPASTDRFTSALSRIGLDVAFRSLEEVEREYPLINSPVTVDSAHTKHALEALHPNIAVFRHPDHTPDTRVLSASFVKSFKSMNLSAASAAKLPIDGLKAIYGAHEDTVLYWAHHEKLCIVDGGLGFMGGLDLCYGRWDTNQHSIADAHPGNLDEIIFPGQDFNNARVMDFQDVQNWQNNKLDRASSSRMGWSDVSISLEGPSVYDMQEHFIQRWNFIYREKYTSRSDTRYHTLSHVHLGHGPSGAPAPGQGGPAGGGLTGHSGNQPQAQQGGYYPPPPKQEQSGYGNRGSRGDGSDGDGERGLFHHNQGQGGHHGGMGEKFKQRMEEKAERLGEKYGVDVDKIQEGFTGRKGEQFGPPKGPVTCQLTRSSARWSHDISVEHSIANAYIDVISKSEHFVYIENQFFITGTKERPKPVKNKIGAAIVERIVRAARNNEKYKMIIVIPAVPGFAGDLKGEPALGTRAIMEFQYDSINRGGKSIMESIALQGVNPLDYIRFYNLRNYDRLNVSNVLKETEQRSGVRYDTARQGHDNTVESQRGQPIYEMDGGGPAPAPNQAAYQQYQQAAAQTGDRKGLGSGRWDSVAECYMLDGEDIRSVPWESGDVNEIDTFVSEQLYVHSKLLIADDKVVICGSANLNDRSQLGDHDSEIAMIIEDNTPFNSMMNDKPYQAKRFAATLRRQIFRKHLGLLTPQDCRRRDPNSEPAGFSTNSYEGEGGEPDQAVADPLSDSFQNLWNRTARTNTEAFDRIFHVVPTDRVRTWKQYDDWYEAYFAPAGEGRPSKYKYGHVVSEDFPGGVSEVKEVLSGIRGTLVEMPLLFLKDEDIAKEGLGLNAFTEEVYT